MNQKTGSHFYFTYAYLLTNNPKSTTAPQSPSAQKEKQMKVISILLCTLLAPFLTLDAFADDPVEVDGIMYNLVPENKSAIVAKNEKEYFYDWGAGYTYYIYSDYSGSIVIPSTITVSGTTYSVVGIGEEAFIKSAIVSVVIPNTVTYIDYGAFVGCDSLISVTISNSVTYIGDYAFQNCYYLSSINIPNSVTTIGEDAFGGCKSLPVIDFIRYADNFAIEAVDKEQATYSIKEGARWIGTYAFRNCSNLASVTIPNSVISIGSQAFEGCSNLTSVTIGNSVTSIGREAFYDCSNLTSVTIGNSVASIGDEAFFGCSNLISVNLPASITSIGGDAFCLTNLQSVYITDLAAWCSISFAEPHYHSYALPIGHDYHLYLNNEELVDLEIPESVTNILDYAFSGCSSLKTITIPNSVTSIGYCAFEDCSNLTFVTIGNSVASIGIGAFEDCCSLTSVNIPESVTSIGGSAFYGCSSLTSIHIPNSVTSIPIGCFYSCTSLTAVTIPNGVTSIELGAFAECAELTSIVIPESVVSIGAIAFYGCEKLTTVIVGMKNPIELFISEDLCPSRRNQIAAHRSGEEDEDEDIEYKTFSNSANATLYVPAGSKSAYMEAEQWKDFRDIVEYTSLEELLKTLNVENSTLADDKDKEVIYDFYGRHLSSKENLVDGLYIINGRKVMVK